MRCPDCATFVGLEMAEPEVESLEIDDDGQISATVRIVRNCAECGNELKEASLDITDNLPDDVMAAHTGEEHGFEIEEDGVEAVEEGGGRYKKSYYGASINYNVKCACAVDPVHTGTLTDKVAASEMEELT